MTQKTILIQKMTRGGPVKTGHRREVKHGLVSMAERRTNVAAELGLSNIMEEYIFEARFGARFFVSPHEQTDEERRVLYERLLKNITESVYGEVRQTVRVLFEVAADVGYLSEIELSHKIVDIADQLMEMTKP